MEYLSTVLEQVNQIRMALAIGDGVLPELPKGVPEHPAQCVLARTLSNGWTAGVTPSVIFLYHEDDEKCNKAEQALGQLGYQIPYSVRGQVSFVPTLEMQMLIRFFDEGRLPELILKD